MRRICNAVRIFFLTLFRSDMARQVEELLARPATAAVSGPKTPEPNPQPPPTAKKISRSEAITLLAAMQREARFVDFIKEPLDSYSDAQIGAAARDVHRQCGKLLDRFFELRPIAADPEGAQIEVPADFDAHRYRLTGNVSAQPPLRGRLVHPGWAAGVCRLPEWSGTQAASDVVAPVEVELT